MSDCLFCKMLDGEIQPDVVYEDDHVMAFRDINPQAPTHVLIVPRRHIGTLNETNQHDAELLGRMMVAARLVAVSEGIAEVGYRTVMNCNAGAGQSVYHIHLHVLGGRPMHWPPG